MFEDVGLDSESLGLFGHWDQQRISHYETGAVEVMKSRADQCERCDLLSGEASTFTRTEGRASEGTAEAQDGTEA